MNFKQFPWHYFVPLDGRGSTIDRCIQSLNLDDHDLMGARGTLRSEDPICNFGAFSAQGFDASTAPLFLSCVYGDDCAERADKLAWHFAQHVKPAYPSAGLLVFSSIHLPGKDTHFQVHVPCQSFNEYERKVARHIELLLEGQPAGSALKPIGPAFSRRILEADGIDGIEVLFDQPYTLRVAIENVPFEMYCNFRSDSEQLIVFGQDAISRSRTKLPHFFRWSWLDGLPTSGIVLNDPTLYLSKDLNGGWFVGTRERDYAQECAAIISRICEIIDSKRAPVFFGASAGGFASLAIASCIPGAKAVVDIPQVDLTTYHAKVEVDRLVRAAFSVDKVSEIPDSLLYRVKIAGRFEYQKRIPEVLYLHNVRDAAHIPQFEGFLKNWSSLAHKLRQNDVGRLQLYTYDRWHISKGGHFPLSKGEVLKQILSFAGIDSASAQ